MAKTITCVHHATSVGLDASAHTTECDVPWRAPFFVKCMPKGPSTTFKDSPAGQRLPKADFEDHAASRAKAYPGAVVGQSDGENVSHPENSSACPQASEGQGCLPGEIGLNTLAEQCSGDLNPGRESCSEYKGDDCGSDSEDGTLQQSSEVLTNEDRAFYGVAACDLLWEQMQGLHTGERVEHMDISSLLEEYKYDILGILSIASPFKGWESILFKPWTLCFGKDRQGLCCSALLFVRSGPNPCHNDSVFGKSIITAT